MSAASQVQTTNFESNELSCGYSFDLMKIHNALIKGSRTNPYGSPPIGIDESSLRGEKTRGRDLWGVGISGVFSCQLNPEGRTARRYRCRLGALRGHTPRAFSDTWRTIASAPPANVSRGEA